jgi:hypothetical protein
LLEYRLFWLHLSYCDEFIDENCLLLIFTYYQFQCCLCSFPWMYKHSDWKIQSLYAGRAFNNSWQPFFITLVTEFVPYLMLHQLVTLGYVTRFVCALNPFWWVGMFSILWKLQLVAGWHVKFFHVFLWVVTYVCYCRCLDVIYKHCDFVLCKPGVILASYLWCIFNKSIFHIYINIFNNLKRTI